MRRQNRMRGDCTGSLYAADKVKFSKPLHRLESLRIDYVTPFKMKGWVARGLQLALFSLSN
jgi:hypothetical protein